MRVCVKLSVLINLSTLKKHIKWGFLCRKFNTKRIQHCFSDGVGLEDRIYSLYRINISPMSMSCHKPQTKVCVYLCMYGGLFI